MAAPYQYPPFSPEGTAMNGTQYAPGSPEAAVMNASRPAPAKAPPINMAVTKPKYTNVASGPANNSLAPKASDFPNVTGLASDMTSNVDDAIKHGDIAGAVGRTTAGMAAMIPAAGVDIYQGLKGAFMPAVGAAQRFAAGVTGGAVSPPTRAGSAAAAAAAKAVEDPIHDNGGPSAPAGGSTPPESDASNANWNAYVQKQLGGMNAQPVAATKDGSPTWTKQAGLDAMNAGGAPRYGDYGPNNAIVMSGATDGNGQSGNGLPGPKGRFNTFTGVGRSGGDAGAGGSGGAGSGNPMQQAQAHLVDIMNQASALRARGDISGALQARGLESHAARMGALFTALGQHSYQQGVLGVQNREAQLRERQANPGITAGEAQIAALKDKNPQLAAEIERSMKGSELSPLHFAQPWSYPVSGDTGQAGAIYPMPNLK